MDTSTPPPQPPKKSRRVPGVVWLGVALLVAGAFWAWVGAQNRRVLEQLSGGSAAAWRAPAVEVPDGVVVPRGMAYVPGGPTEIGSEHGSPGEQPVFWAEVEPFFLDVFLVTVADFREFVRATGHVTDAEKSGHGGVLDLDTNEWTTVAGATWQEPLGPDEPPAPDDHPVTQVSWNDAVAYARWMRKRLPTEIEWEHAARGARNARGLYSWGGDSLVVGGYPRANTADGEFADGEGVPDGFLMTSPVGEFGRTSLGLTDMGGNVWQWCADWYRSYAEREQAFSPTAESGMALRGGSFLCTEETTHGYRVSARAHLEPGTPRFNVGFRCARSLPRDVLDRE